MHHVHRRRFATSLSLLALLVWSAPAGAAEADRDTHYRTVRLLIDHGLRLPAERGIEGFKKAGYTDGADYVDGLEWALAGQFRTLVGERGEDYAQRFKELDQRLKASLDRLPPLVRQHIETGGGQLIKQISREIQETLNPDAPPELVKMKEQEVRDFLQKLRRLIVATDERLDEIQARIDAHKPKEDAVDLDETARLEVTKKATFLRYEYANAFYQFYKSAREIITRGEAFGLPPEAETLVEEWLHAKLAAKAEEFGEWEWLYADYYPFLKHRLNVIRMEGVRLNKKRSDLGDIRTSGYQDVLDGIRGATDLDTSPYQGQTKSAVELLKLEAWSDVLLWHIALGGKFLDTGIDMWENDFLNRPYQLKYSSDKFMEQSVGHMYIVAARLYHARGDTSKRDETLAELKSSGNYFAGNATLWFTYFSSLDTGKTAWGEIPSAIDPDIAVNMGSALWRQRGESIDEEEIRGFSIKAISKLRSGIAGLSQVDGKTYLALAPKLYRRYAFYLYKMGWYHQASLVAREGLRHFKRRWRGPDDNSWIDRRSKKLNAGGKMVQTLAKDFLSYAMGLRSRTGSEAADLLFQQSIEMLKTFNPEEAEDLEWIPVVLMINQGRYDEAVEGAEEYLRKHPEAVVKVRVAIAKARFKQWDEAVREESRDLDEVASQLDAALDALETAIEPYRDSPPEDPKKSKQVKEAGSLILSVRVAKLMRERKYATVRELLGPEFWENPPGDADISIRMMLNLANANYKLVVAIAKDQKALLDVERFLEDWEHYSFAREAFDALLVRFPEALDRVATHRRLLAQVFDVSRRQAEAIAQNAKAGADGFEEQDGSRFAEIALTAKRAYADVIEPIIDRQTRHGIIIKVAYTLWDLGEAGRAARLFLLYKETLKRDASLQNFKANLPSEVEKYKKTFSTRTAFKPFWNGKGSIPDLLVDDPGFFSEYLNSDKPEADWPEEQRDYAAALKKVRKFHSVVKGETLQARQREELLAELDELENLVQGLAYTIDIDSKLAKYYRDVGEHAKAVELAQGLYRYDPRNPTFMSLFVDGTIEAVKTDGGGELPKKTLEEARRIAIQLRTDTKPHASLRKEYWTAVCQIMELSFALGEVDTIKRMLGQYTARKQTPDWDFAEEVDGRKRLIDQSGADICRRFLAVFDFPGVDLAKPFAVVTDEQGDHWIEPADGE